MKCLKADPHSCVCIPLYIVVSQSVSVVMLTHCSIHIYCINSSNTPGKNKKPDLYKRGCYSRHIITSMCVYVHRNSKYRYIVPNGTDKYNVHNETDMYNVHNETDMYNVHNGTDKYNVHNGTDKYNVHNGTDKCNVHN